MIHRKTYKSTTMDLRIAAKKFHAATAAVNEIDAYNQMGGCPTPPPSSGSNPRTPESLSSCTVSRSSSVDDNAPPTQPRVQQKTLANAESNPQKDKIPHSMMPPLVFRPIDNYSKINQNKLISIDNQGFFNNKRLRVQTENDLFNDDNPAKRFKPVDFQILANTQSSTGDKELLALLKSALGDRKCPPGMESHASLDWLGYFAKTQSENKENAIPKSLPGKGVLKRELQEGDTPAIIDQRFEDIIADLIENDFGFVYTLDENIFLDFNIDKVTAEQNAAAKTEESTGQSPKILQDSSGQLYVPLQHSIDLKKYQVQPVTFVTPVSDEKLKSVPAPVAPQCVSSEAVKSVPAPSVASETLKSVPKPVMQQEVSNGKLKCVPESIKVQGVSSEKLRSVADPVKIQIVSSETLKHVAKPLMQQEGVNGKFKIMPEPVKPQSISKVDVPQPVAQLNINNIIEQVILNKYHVAKPLTAPTIATIKQEVGSKQNPSPKPMAPPSKSKSIEQEFSEKYPYLVNSKLRFSAPGSTAAPPTAKRNPEEFAKTCPHPAGQTPPTVKQTEELAKNYMTSIDRPNLEIIRGKYTRPLMQRPTMAPQTITEKKEIANKSNSDSSPKIDMKLATMLPHLASYNPDLFVPKLITDLTGRPIKQEFVNLADPNPIEPEVMLSEPPKTARQKLEAKFPLMAEYHRKYILPKPSEEETTNEPIPFPPMPISLPTTDPIGREVAQKYPHPAKHNPDLYVIGPNGSTISKAAWANISWTQTPAAITRKILMCLFDKYTLATHSLSGRPSPAFKGIYKTEKLPLHTGKVADTVSIVTSRVNVTPKEVRMAITTKCADECKMLRLRQEKKAKLDREFLANLEMQQM